MKHAHHRVGIALGLGLTIYACGGASSGDSAGCPGPGGMNSMAGLGGGSAAGETGRLGAGDGGGGELTGAGATAAAGGADADQGGTTAPGGVGGANGGRADDGIGDGGALAAGANQGGASGGGASVGGAAGSAGGDSMVPGTIEIVGDTSWRTYGTDSGEAPPTGWTTSAFDDSSWVASVAPNPAACGTYEPIQPWDRTNAPMWDVSNKYSAFFRKIVTLPAGATVSYAKITIFADDDIEIWVNGVQAFVEDNFGVVAGGVIEPHEIDLKPFLLPGANLIAIHAQDSVGGGCRWAIVSGSVGMTYPTP